MPANANFSPDQVATHCRTRTGRYGLGCLTAVMHRSGGQGRRRPSKHESYFHEFYSKCTERYSRGFLVFNDVK